MITYPNDFLGSSLSCEHTQNTSSTANIEDDLTSEQVLIMDHGVSVRYCSNFILQHFLKVMSIYWSIRDFQQESQKLKQESRFIWHDCQENRNTWGLSQYLMDSKVCVGIKIVIFWRHISITPALLAHDFVFGSLSVWEDDFCWWGLQDRISDYCCKSINQYWCTGTSSSRKAKYINFLNRLDWQCSESNYLTNSVLDVMTCSFSFGRIIFTITVSEWLNRWLNCLWNQKCCQNMVTYLAIKLCDCNSL